jgi:hypothetical protein
VNRSVVRRNCTADRAYDSEPHREELRARGIEPKVAKRNTENGSGLGVFRWVAERTISWLHGFRKLRFVTDDSMPFATGLFRTHVGWRSCVSWPLVYVLLTQSQSEVGHERLAGLVQQDVAGLDVPMDQSLLVGVVQRLGHRR